MSATHTQTRAAATLHPHSRYFPHRTPYMQSRTGDGLHQTQRRGQGSMAPGCTRAHTDQQTGTSPKRKQRAAHPPPGWRADASSLQEHRQRRSKCISACHLRCRGQQGAGEGGHRQQAHTHKHTTAVTKMMAGAHHHHHHPTTRAPSQSSVAVNGPQTTRAVRKVTRLRFARERGAGWGAWRWGRGGNWQLEGANHQAPPNRAGAHNLPCSGGSQVTLLPCLVCAKRRAAPCRRGHPACRDRQGDAATEATEATGGDGSGAVGTLV